ncbi:hypothetical protein BCR36DRAFT_119132 [Piromyces finnis]|uniref:Uncharacterized protein n=1 Tax=Piromyces finnis TaxID=1754191 RepID=A0A1Y1V309_9FUNG|nr:hypothetical protein BCR36DRAFT_119132 [Piromyces finnis]|eukprot:ORX45198.1 hypothetical protein BCR36DRAFT_119132 [Piromyces finnis]
MIMRLNFNYYYDVHFHYCYYCIIIFSIKKIKIKYIYYNLIYMFYLFFLFKYLLMVCKKGIVYFHFLLIK